MAKPKFANLIFKSGQMKSVPMKDATWPRTIEHRMDDKVVRFEYVGVQHGIGAYVEQQGAV